MKQTCNDDESHVSHQACVVKYLYLQPQHQAVLAASLSLQKCSDKPITMDANI